MDLYIVEESEYFAWQLASTTIEHNDPKGREGLDFLKGGVDYLTPSKFFDSLPKVISRVTSFPNEKIGRIIERVTGEYPRLYSDAEIRTEISHHEYTTQWHPLKSDENPRYYGDVETRWLHSESDEILNQALSLARYTPSYSIASLVRRIDRYGNCYINNAVSNSESVIEAGLVDGQMLMLRRRLSRDICSMAASIVWRRNVCARVIRIRNADDFTSQVIGVQDPRNAMESLQSHKQASWGPGRRTRIVLLYTEEDLEIATYVRSHFNELDKLSGRNFDIFVVEKPSAVQGYTFWRSILPETLYVIWAMAGFVGTRPYDKSECYRIAEFLGIAPNHLPCAVELPRTDGMAVESITPLRGNLTRVFRDLCSTDESPHMDKRSEASSNQASTLCFMSHNSRDKSVVREVAAVLHAAGIECWLDEWEILPGDNITREISAGIEKATHLAFFMSQASVRSNWVDEEINASLYRAISSRKQKLIPVMLEPCDPPALIAGNARIAMGRDSQRIAEELIRAIQKRTNKPVVAVRPL